MIRLPHEILLPACDADRADAPEKQRLAAARVRAGLSEYLDAPPVPRYCDEGEDARYARRVEKTLRRHLVRSACGGPVSGFLFSVFLSAAVRALIDLAVRLVIDRLAAQSTNHPTPDTGALP